jgi:hypothetical protein
MNIEFPDVLSPNKEGKVLRPPVKRGRGRPKKSEIEAYKKPKGSVGRPLGDGGRMKELKARLLATSGERIIDKVIQIAGNDEHPGQMAALKMCWDRMLPTSLFEKDAKTGKSAVTINIVGVDGVQISSQEPDENTIEMEPADET